MMKSKKDHTIKVRIPVGYMPKDYEFVKEGGKTYLYIRCIDGDFQEMLKMILKKTDLLTKK